MFKIFCTAALLAAAPLGVAGSIGFKQCGSAFPHGYRPGQPWDSAELCRENQLAISYDIDMVAPAWAAYQVTGADVDRNIPGRKSFYADPDLKSLGVTQASYSNQAFSSAWNRGHLAPSRIMSSSSSLKKATYTMANVAPQAGYFNQRAWATLESEIFDFIDRTDKTLHIVTGVAYTNRRFATKKYGIAVPDYFWKAICDTKSRISAGFIGKNIQGKHWDALEFRTVDDVEELYGYSIFPSKACSTRSVQPHKWWSWSRRAAAGADPSAVVNSTAV